MTTLVLLGGGQDFYRIGERAWRMHIETVVVDQIRPDGWAHHWLEASCYDIQETVSALQSWCAKNKSPDGVLCAGTDAPHVMAAVAKNWGLSGISEATAELSRNKLLQYERLQSAGLTVPKTLIAEVADRYGMRGVVFKPALSRGSRGVQRYAANDLIPVTAVDAAARHGGPALIQEWIEGAQISSESLVQDGKILWTSFVDRNYSRLEEFKPHVIEDGCDAPSSVPVYYENDWQYQAEDQLQRAAEAIGMRSGILKGDLVWDGRLLWVIEVATRLSGGGFCSEITPEVWGVDFVGMAIRLALGDYIWPGEIRPCLRRHVCQRFYFPKRPTSHPERGPYALGRGSTSEEALESAQKRLRIMIEDIEKSREHARN